MFFKKEATNDSMLAAIGSASVDDALKGKDFISVNKLTAESDKEAIRQIAMGMTE